jgi:hypothetical protein
MMRRKHVIGRDGRRIAVADLPSPDTKRWVIRRNGLEIALHAPELEVIVRAPPNWRPARPAG